MLGFKFYIYRQRVKKEFPASLDSKHLWRLLSFETDLYGFNWIDEATKNKSILFLGGYG